VTRLGLRARLLTALSGDPDGTPSWVRALAEGDDGGYFADGGAVWTVHAGTATFVAGIRALLMQALHPGAMAGVHDFSRYREDPIGRLTGTVRWVICVTYGSTQQAHAETARVGRLHQRVAGTYSTETGPRTYTASDASLLEWVHLAFTEAFLGAHQRWGGPIPGGADAYVREWAQAGRLMRVPSPPETEADLRSRMDAYLDRGELRCDARVTEVVQYLRDVPFTGSMRFAYRVLFAAAVASLPRQYRKLLGLRRSILPVVTATRIVLAISSRALASGPRAQDFARQRHDRLQHTMQAAPLTKRESAIPSAADYRSQQR
jgi:uncharacterized protein (DUF2236 family)